MAQAQKDDEDLQLREIIQSLLDAVSYVSPRQMMSAGSSQDEDALRSALNVEINSWTTDGTQRNILDSLSKKAASVVEVSPKRFSLITTN